MCALNVSEWPFVWGHPVTIQNMPWQWVHPSGSYFTALEVPRSFVNKHTWQALKTILEHYLAKDFDANEFVAGNYASMSLHRRASHVRNKFKFGLTSSKPNRKAFPPFRGMGPRIYIQGVHPELIPPHQEPHLGWQGHRDGSPSPASFQYTGISLMIQDINLYVAQMCYHDRQEHRWPLCW